MEQYRQGHLALGHQEHMSVVQDEAGRVVTLVRWEPAKVSRLIGRPVKVKFGAPQWPIYPSNPEKSFEKDTLIHPDVGVRVTKHTVKNVASAEGFELPAKVV
eukprot:1534778-Karenia_brevis.AAC.1